MKQLAGVASSSLASVLKKGPLSSGSKTELDRHSEAIASLATSASDSSSDASSTLEPDSDYESISFPTKACALPDELFLCDEDFAYFFFFLSSES